MNEFIPSAYYRKYCKDNGIEITDRNLAAAILNGVFDPPSGEAALLEEKFSELKKISVKTEDNELKALISEVIENSETSLKNLKNGGKNCIYELSVSFIPPTEKEWYRYESFYFYDYDTAFNYALSHAGEMGVLRSFDIEKLRIFNGKESPKTRSWGETACFNSSGELLRIYGGKEQAFNKLCALYAAANPFVDLDIVMHCCGGELGIVEGSEDASKGEISVLFEEGYIMAVSPMCLEKIDGNSEPVLRERAVKIIREKLNCFDEEKAAALEEMITELSDS